MTHSGGKPHTVGDQGQRYEVSVYDEDKGERVVCGWSDDPEIARQMATSFAKRPGWSLEQILDRWAGRDFSIRPITKLSLESSRADLLREIARLTTEVKSRDDALREIANIVSYEHLRGCSAETQTHLIRVSGREGSDSGN